MRYGGVVAVLAWFASSIKVFFVWQAFSSIISVLLFVCLVYKTLPKPNKMPKFSTKAIKEVWRFASGMLGITFLALLLTQIDKVILSKIITLESYGYYTLAATVTGCLALISVPTTQAIYPKMVEYVAQKKSQELTNLYHQGAQLISVLIAPVAMMLVFFGKDIIYIWSSDINLATKTAPILLPLALGSFLNCLVWMPYQLQLAHGWTSFAVTVNTIAVVLLVPAIFLVTPSYGAVGAAWVWALLNTGYVTIAMHYMYKKLMPEEKWRWYWHDVIKQLMPAIIVMVIIKLIITDFMFNNMTKFVLCLFALFAAIFAAIWQSNQIKPLMLLSINKIFMKAKK